MDGERFDRIVRRFDATTPRRSFVAAAVGLALGRTARDAAAGNKKQCPKKKVRCPSGSEIKCCPKDFPRCCAEGSRAFCCPKQAPRCCPVGSGADCCPSAFPKCCPANAEVACVREGEPCLFV